MTRSSEYLVFLVEGKRCALPLGVVQRVVRSAEITPLPSAPGVVLGMLDIEGAVLPVLSLRHRFGLRERQIRITDHFLIAHTEKRALVLVIDEAQGVIAIPAHRITQASGVVPGLHGHLQGVASFEDGLVLIHDLEAFLSLQEAAALDAAMSATGGAS